VIVRVRVRDVEFVAHVPLDYDSPGARIVFKYLHLTTSRDTLSWSNGPQTLFLRCLGHWTRSIWRALCWRVRTLKGLSLPHTTMDWQWQPEQSDLCTRGFDDALIRLES
jgi:hypothetical protein